jgi:hypothetical protein
MEKMRTSGADLQLTRKDLQLPMPERKTQLKNGEIEGKRGNSGSFLNNPACDFTLIK